MTGVQTCALPISRNTVTRLGDEVKRIMAFPEFQSSLAAVGMTPVASTPAEFSTFLKREMAKYARVTQEAGVKPE